VSIYILFDFGNPRRGIKLDPTKFLLVPESFATSKEGRSVGRRPQ